MVRTIGIPVIENGEVIRLRGSIQDITAQKRRKEGSLACPFRLPDGLPNRTLLNDRPNYAIRIAYRNHTSVAPLYLDLDHFKHQRNPGTISATNCSSGCIAHPVHDPRTDTLRGRGTNL